MQCNVRFGGTLIFHGFNNQWRNKVLFVGGLALKSDGYQWDIELDEMSCQSGSCAWANIGVSLATPRHYGIVMVVPELMACQAESGVSNYTTPAPPSTCNNGWIGDYYCDDINNNMDCNYDGGDCCGTNVNSDYCQICGCLDPNGNGGGGGSGGGGGGNSTTNQPPASCNSGWIADGYCDDVNNNMDCNYDGGDCCGPNVNTQYCDDCQCLDPNGSSGGGENPLTSTPSGALKRYYN